MKLHRDAALTLLLLCCGMPGLAKAATVQANLTQLSLSQPHLDAAGTDWAPFSVKLGVLTANSPIVIQYVPTPFDSTAFPLQVAGATVTLRPGTTAAALTCTQADPIPVVSSTNVGQCFFRRQPGLGDTIEIYHHGLLKLGEDIRITIAGVTAAAAASHTVVDFDSDTVIPGTPPSPTTGRTSARLVLVLDKSGSMAWSSHPADPGCGGFSAPSGACLPARWTILNSAATQLATVAKAYAIPGDQFGVSLFSTGATALTSLTTMNSTTLNAFLTALGAQSPGGATSIGAGVTLFQSDLTGPDADDYNQVMLLFTDGDQNTAPFLKSNGTTLVINPTSNSPIGPGVTDFTPPGVELKVCPFALRADDASGLLGTNELADIAALRCDNLMNSSMSVAPGDPQLLEFFLLVLEEALIGDKLELIAVQGGSFEEASPQAAAPVASFITSAEDASLTLLLNWAQRGNGVRSVVLSKDGVNFPITSESDFAEIDGGRDFLTVTLRAPFCNDDDECVDPAGEWQLFFEPIFEVAERLDFNLFVLGDNRTLASSYKVEQPTPGVGQPLRLSVVLSEGGEPVTGLAPGRVQAVVAGPGSSLGNVLSKAQVSPVDPAEGDQISAAGRKVAAMLADAALRPVILEALTEQAPDTVPLTEASPGTYTADYADVASEGVYAVAFQVQAAAPENGDFTRTYRTDYYVRVVPDPAASAAGATSMQIDCPRGPAVTTTLPPTAGPLPAGLIAGGCYRFTFSPVDTAGNLLGPGKGGIFVIRDPGGVVLGSVADRLDGAYVFDVGYPGAVKPGPSIQIGDSVIELPAPDVGILEILQAWLVGHVLWLLALLLLMIVLFIWALARRI